jgi:hypothetical protein
MTLRIAMVMTGGGVRKTLKEWKHDLHVRGIVRKHTHTPVASSCACHAAAEVKLFVA